LDLGYTIYAYESKLKEKVDFIIIKNDEIKYVQVTYELNNDNFARETKSLLHATNAYKKIILTLVNNATLDTRGIKVINIIDWLTEKIEL
jgi:predicted AAA+ superfamily ATPase